ncbi:iron chelate uptake ABC transporter family permease subunit [Mumia zhuanghuii]|uniref:FecCD family ABC transporter permease n=2 Tax=Mumia TaxID=1546255 RepID=A0ABW1QKV4_9ACTN|nr:MULTISPECIES: iron chelate uptake ABC transporter family permease subunit [Mumia]KAA1424922.1 iron chelate uptake ABC transporter family permease subunit [Mumia zhuanghuii]
MTLTLPATDGAERAVAPDLRRRRTLGLVVVLATLVVAVGLSLALGSKPLSLGEVIGALTGAEDGSEASTIVIGQRIPRTVVALLVGAALAVAGALMQGLTRNPLADPGLLGVGAGSAFAMAVGFMLFPGLAMLGLVGFSFAGAIVTTVAVYLIGTAGRGGATPLTLTLAGVAIAAVLSGLTSIMRILSASTFSEMRVWDAGVIANRGWDVIGVVAPFIVAGLLLAAAAAHGLNAVALGDDLATALGSNQRRTRIEVVVGVTLLCGAATAAVGPIWFLGLMVPHVARWLTGPDQRWILAYSALIGPVILLLSDVIGRMVVRPDEISAGVVTALVGAPVLIAMVRRPRASAL